MGVLGETHTLSKPRSTKAKAAAKAAPAKSGVLGETHTLGSTVTSSTLPFTGLKLWLFALVAAALISLGLIARRTTGDNRI